MPARARGLAALTLPPPTLKEKEKGNISPPTVAGGSPIRGEVAGEVGRLAAGHCLPFLVPSATSFHRAPSSSRAVPSRWPSSV